jgi:FkbM family methyltransferase
MRKIFIDGGANIGQSLEAFCKGRPDIAEYEIFCFEASQDSLKILEPLKQKIKDYEKVAKKITLINSAIWDKDGTIDFFDAGNESSSIVDRNLKDGKMVQIPCVDLSGWIQKNFTENDHIILKLDIEGSEHEVFEKLCNDEIIGWLNKIYCEIHGIKCGYSFKEVIEMINQVNSHGKKLICWAAIDRYGQDGWKETEYNPYQIKKEFHKWYMRTVKNSIFDKDGKQIRHLPFSMYALNSVVSGLVELGQLGAEFEEDGRRYRVILGEKSPHVHWVHIE